MEDKTMTQEQIIAIATQAAIAAVQATMGATAPVSNPTKAQGARSKGQDKPKALPDATATTINDIVAGATKESVENGKTIEVPKGKAILMEYSEKQLAIWGDTKEHRAIIKKYGGEKTTRFGTIWGYKPEGVTEENLAKGWFIPKSKLTENGGKKAMIAELKKAGLKVTEGESIRAITEAYRAAREKEQGAGSKEQEQGAGSKEQVTATTATTTEKPKKGQGARSKGQEKPKTSKVVPIKVDEYSGIAYGQVAVENGATFQCFPDNPDLYIRDNKLYVCIGTHEGETVFLHVGNKKDNAIPELIKQVADKGILRAISEGIVKNVLPYVVEAFKSLDNQDGYNWLVQCGYATAA